MRIIGGEARGRRLVPVPAGVELRPTLDRVRESLFNVLAPDVPGCTFLDLFAGTGANGIEALSRGAQSASFVDSDPKAYGIIRENLNKLGFAHRADCWCTALPQVLQKLGHGYDIVFADPPYGYDGIEALIDAIVAHGVVNQHGIVALEHARKAAVPDAVGPLPFRRQKRYGQTALSFFA